MIEHPGPPPRVADSGDREEFKMAIDAWRASLAAWKLEYDNGNAVDIKGLTKADKIEMRAEGASGKAAAEKLKAIRIAKKDKVK